MFHIVAQEQKLFLFLELKANPSKGKSKPVPIRVSFGTENPTDLLVEEVLKHTKLLKDSLKFKKVLFSKDLTLPQIVQLKIFIRTRNDESDKLKAMHVQAIWNTE